MKQNQILAIRKFMFTNKTTITDISKDIGVSRSYVSMALNGRLQNETVDKKIMEWFLSRKEIAERG